MHEALGTVAALKRRLVTPSSDTITSSPGSTSRSYFACSRSNAHVSDANTNVSGAPSTPVIRPIDSGRNPCGSRAAKMRFRVIITIENAPSTCASESAMQSTSVDALRVRDQLNDDLRVLRRLEHRTIALQPLLRIPQVHQVAVMRNRNQPLASSPPRSAAHSAAPNHP